jgi:hypothetical protein
VTAPQALIRLAGLERYVVPGRHYPAPLPPALEASYCYTSDGGHSVIVVLENEYPAAAAEQDPLVPISDYLVPAPVRTVLRRGYTVRNHLIECEVRPLVWCRIPHSRETGLLTEEADDEF